MWRKRRTPSPAFRMPPPLDPFSGQHQGLPGERDRTRVALFQVCEADTHDDYVVCRGYDTEEGRFYKTLPIAKPFERRGFRDYYLAEVLICGTASTELGDNPGKTTETTGTTGTGTAEPESVTTKLVLLYDDETPPQPIRWIHIGTGMRLRVVELYDTLWPKGASPTINHAPPSTSSSSSTSSTSTTPDPDALPHPSRFDDARGWLLWWDEPNHVYDAPDYNSNPDVMVHERASSYFGMGYQDALPGKRGDIVCINEYDVVVGGPYPILVAEIRTGLGCGGTASVRLLDCHPSATLAVDAWDRMETMNAQVNPCIDPLEVRTAASAGDKLEMRWDKYTTDAKSPTMEIITLGGDCGEQPCYCEYQCQGSGAPDYNDWVLYLNNCGVGCDMPTCEAMLPGPCIEYDLLDTACNWTG